LERAIIKSFLSTEAHLLSHSEDAGLNRYNGFQFLSVDFVLDENLNPFLLEFNRNSVPRDFRKQQMVAQLLTIAGVHLPPLDKDAVL
jgi:hypothetical protein